MIRSSIARTGLAVALVLGVVAASGCAARKQRKEAEDYLTPEERYSEGMRAIENRNLRRANNILSQIDYYSATEQNLEPLVRLALADSTYYKSNELAYIDARALYIDFVTLFGDHARAPYAQFQAGMCSLSQVRHPSRDQTQTLQAISDFEIVEDRWPSSPYAAAARLMRRQAEGNLVRHELIVGRFYFKRKHWDAAADRLREVLDRYPDYDDREEVYFQLGQALLNSGNDAEARIYLDKLVRDFPEGEYTEQARVALQRAGGGLKLEVSDQ